MTLNAAQIIGLKALTFVAADEERITNLCALTGIEAIELKRFAGNDEVLAGILDFLLEDESILLKFCRVADLQPETPKLARDVLSGVAPEW